MAHSEMVQPSVSNVHSALTGLIPRISRLHLSLLSRGQEAALSMLGLPTSISPKSQAESLYENLQKQDLVRLIKLDPKAANTPNGYKIKTFHLSDAPKYYALSYCWGSSDRSTQITCNGKPLKISYQLSQGLQELQKIPILAGRWFWVDQICVNQEDLDERAHQVGLMRQIYSGTISTVIWLGPQDLECEDAFVLMKKISQICQSDPNTNKPKWAKYSWPLLHLADEDEVLGLGLPDFAHPAWQQLGHLLNRPWFSRMWIVQEVLLSKKLPLLVYGSKTRDWNDILWSGIWISQRGVFRYAGLTGVHLQPLMALFLIWNSKGPWELQSLCISTKGSIATDQRDRVFALLSLAAETRDNTSYPSQLEPDYKKSVEQVYRDFTLYCISASRSLILLTLCVNDDNFGCRKDGTGQLSWLPKFQGPNSAVGSSYWIKSDTHNRVHYNFSSMKASKSIPASLQESKDPNCLVLQGLQMREVSWASSKVSQSRDSFLPLQWCEEASRLLVPSPYQTFQDFLDQFIRTISRIAAPDVSKYPSTGDFWTYISEEAIKIPNLIYFVKCLKESSPDETGNASQVRVAIDNIRMWDFFITSTHTMGIGPKGIKVGDIICVLFGGQTPFVLRPCPDRLQPGQVHYHLLGDCFCIGLMEGEAIDQWNEGHIEPKWFTLK